MKKELTSRQLAFLAAIILFGRLSLIGESSVGRDIWLVFIIVPLLGLPLVRMYSMLRIDNEKGTKDLFRLALGRIPGAVAVILLILVAIIIASSGVTLFTVFISSTPVENNLLLPSIIVMCITISLLMSVSEGTLGRSSMVTFPMIALLLVVSFAASIKHMDFGAILPVAEYGYTEIAKGILTSIGFQVAPLVFLIFSTARCSSAKKVGRAVSFGLLCACALLMLAHLRNVLILGYPSVSLFRFPNYIALTQINMGDLFQGMEIVMTQAFLLCQPIKSAMCLRFASQMLTEYFPKTKMVWPIALPLLAGALTLLNYGDAYDLVISNFYLRSFISFTLIGIPFIMLLSLALRKKLRKS
ncbi:MAG: GerAB/ArcD/ProY family transporter [Clostridia bacterium]|nr:GerAB/ArcD/ProY family transporter [Clostridia bacterium]MBR4955199.1 GerAB/ArcD/ProY family transporter [Clostridia bacterium]